MRIPIDRQRPVAMYQQIEHKRLLDLSTSNVLQRAVEAYVTVGRYQAHLRRTIRAYRQRRDVMLEALQRHAPELSVVRPSGGLFLWVGLPAQVSARQLLRAARDERIDVADGPRFFLDPQEGDGFIRVTFAAHAPRVIQEGVRRLARALRRVQAASGGRR